MKTKKFIQKQLFLVLLICLAPAFIKCAKSQIDTKNELFIEPVDKGAITEVTKVLNWVCNVTNRKSNRIIAGQYSYKSCEAIAKLTNNKWPALMEETLWQKNGRDDGWTTGWERATSAKQHCLEYWDNGGLISIHMPVPNPFNKTDQLDISKPENENWNDVFVPGTNAFNNLVEWVDVLSTHLQWLQNNGIVTFIRPFHENLGKWFWYGAPRYNSKEFAKLYQWIFTYLTQEKQLHNLIFVFSPNKSTDNVMDYFPGNEYVDIIALDSYTTPILDNIAVKSINDIKAASAKPFGISELGWNSREISEYEKDSREYIQAIKGKAPHALYFSIWGGSNAPHNQNECVELYKDPWIITRDEVDWK